MRLTEAVNVTHIKTNIKGFSFWAKRLDTYAHIVKKNSNNIGCEVYCGRF